MPENGKYVLEIFGQEFILTTTDGEEEDLANVSEYFKKVAEELHAKFPKRPQLDIAILAGLKITDEYYAFAKAKKKSINEEKNFSDVIDEAIKRLDISLNL